MSAPHRVLMMVSSMRGGGSERQTLLLLKHLDRTRFEPHLYLSQRDGELLGEVPADVPVHAYEPNQSSGGLYYPGRAHAAVVGHLQRLLGEMQIDAIYDRTLGMTMIAGPAARRLGIGRVSTIVSPPHLALPLVQRRFVRFKRRRLILAYRQSSAVVAVSRVAAESARQYYRLAENQVQVIPNPVDIEAIRMAAAAQPPPARDERLTIVCVGRMSDEKGHDDLIAAISRSGAKWPEAIPPAVFWLIGDGPNRPRLEAAARRAGGFHEIRFFGAMPNAAAAIAAADALVLPSRFEGMPNVVLEAMALGTAVIATRSGGTIELQRDEPTMVWAEPMNPESLADALIEFVCQPESVGQRAAAAKKMISLHHDVRSNVGKIEALLESAISGL